MIQFKKKETKLEELIVEILEEPEGKKKNDLDTKKLDKLIRRVYDQKYNTYDKNGKLVEYSEPEDNT